MAWTSPRTWAASETVTAAIMNTHVRDNFNAIVSPPYAYVRATTATTVGGSAYANISFNTEVVDTDSMYTSASPTRLTIATSGLYLLTGGFSMNLTAGTIATVHFTVNGTALAHTGNSFALDGGTSSAAKDIGLSLTCFYQLTAGDYVQLSAYSTRTAVSTLVSSADQAFMQVRWMGP